MNIQPKNEPGSPPGFLFTNPNYNFEQMSIPELITFLRSAVIFEHFDDVQHVLMNRDMGLREQIHRLQKQLEVESNQLTEKLQLERLSKLNLEVELKKREELCEKGKRAKESYEALLKEVKRTSLFYRNAIEDLRKKNGEFESEVLELRKVKEKCEEERKEFDVVMKKNGVLECEVLEFKKLKEKWEEERKELDMVRKKNGELECEVLELRRMKKKWLDDSNELEEIRRKFDVLKDEKNALGGVEVKNGELEEIVSELRKENSKLADEKVKAETLLASLNTKFRRLHGRVSKLEDDTKLLMSIDASGGGNNVVKPSADVGDKDEEDVPLQRNEDDQDSLGVGVSTQQPSKASENAQGESLASARLKSEKAVEIINLDDDDHDDQFMSQGVHEKKAISEIAVKNEQPSQSLLVSVQPEGKFADAVDAVKRKYSFNNYEASISTSSSSSDDMSYLDNLTIKSVISQVKKKKT